MPTAQRRALARLDDEGCAPGGVGAATPAPPPERRWVANVAGGRARARADLEGLYREALEAVRPDGSPDLRTRVLERDALLAQAYGKPVQPTEEHGNVAPVGIYRPARD